MPVTMMVVGMRGGVRGHGRSMYAQSRALGDEGWWCSLQARESLTGDDQGGSRCGAGPRWTALARAGRQGDAEPGPRRLLQWLVAAWSKTQVTRGMKRREAEHAPGCRPSLPGLCICRCAVQMRHADSMHLQLWNPVCEQNVHTEYVQSTVGTVSLSLICDD